MEKSLEEKVGQMNGLSFEIIDDILKGNQELLTKEEGDDLEEYVDGKITFLNNLKTRLLTL